MLNFWHLQTKIWQFQTVPKDGQHAVKDDKKTATSLVKTGISKHYVFFLFLSTPLWFKQTKYIFKLDLPCLSCEVIGVHLTHQSQSFQTIFFVSSTSSKAVQSSDHSILFIPFFSPAPGRIFLPMIQPVLGHPQVLQPKKISPIRPSRFEGHVRGEPRF